MNSIFSIKSSIAMLVLGISLIASPKPPIQSTLEALSSYQPEIAASAIGAIATAMHYEIV